MKNSVKQHHILKQWHKRQIVLFSARVLSSPRYKTCYISMSCLTGIIVSKTMSVTQPSSAFSLPASLSGNSSHPSRTLIMFSQKVKLTSGKRPAGTKDRVQPLPCLRNGGVHHLLALHWFTNCTVRFLIRFLYTASDRLSERVRVIPFSEHHQQLFKLLLQLKQKSQSAFQMPWNI